MRIPAVCLLIVALLFLSVPGDQERLHAQTPKIQKLGGGRFMTETVREVQAGNLKTLRITSSDDLGGAITILAQGGAVARLQMLKIFKVGSESEVEAAERDLAFEVAESGSSLNLKLTTHAKGLLEDNDQETRVEITATIPENWDVEFNGRFFDLDMNGPFRRVEVTTEYGRVKLTNASERVRITGAHTAVEVVDARGDIAARTSFADLVVRGAIPSAERPARLTNSFGSIVVERLAGAVVAETENAPIFASEVVLLGSGSSLRAANAMVKADIREFGNAELSVRTSNGAVILRVPKTVSARLTCVVGTGGSIQTGGLAIQTHPNLLGLERLEGVCGRGIGLIDIDIDGPGQIGIQGF